MKQIVLGMWVAIALSLSTGTAFAATSKCKYDRTRDKGFVLAENAKGKSVKGHYLDMFTNQLVVSTEWADISHPVRPTGREMTGFVSALSIGDQSTEYSAKIEEEHDKFLFLQIEYLRPKKTFPTEDELQNSISVPSGGELLIGLADGSVVTLYATNAVTGETTYETPDPHSGTEFWLMSKASMNFKLDAGAQTALTATAARAVRLITASGDLDIRIHGAGTDNIQKVINCVRGAM